jgi:hypothetical protein
MKRALTAVMIFAAIAITSSEANTQYVPMNKSGTMQAGPDNTMAEDAQRMVTIDADGSVYIDWHLVSKTARGDGPKMILLVAISKVLIAVRDRKWKPMSKMKSGYWEGSNE